jgi:hypothetical protein
VSRSWGRPPLPAATCRSILYTLASAKR